MPSNFTLSYAVASIMIKDIRSGFDQDNEPYNTDNTNRIKSPMMLDGWNYKIREFPSIIITSIPGTTKRMGIGDVGPIPSFLVKATEIELSPIYSNKRKFRVSNILPTGTLLEVDYKGTPATTPAKFENVQIEDEVIDGQIYKYIEITGSTIKPNETYPRQNFVITTYGLPTGDTYGGMMDLRAEITVLALSHGDRQIVSDKLWSMLWFSKKRELLAKGVVILDVSLAGSSVEDYGADKIYFSKFNVPLMTEWNGVISYLDTIENITVQGTAIVS